MLSINPAVPANNFPEFIEYARNSKPPLPYGSSGNGSQHHLSMEMLKRRAGIDLLSRAVSGCRTGDHGDGRRRYQGSVLGLGQRSPPGVRATAPARGERQEPLKRFPDLPTIGEVYPGFEVDIWLGVFAPAGTPEPVVTTLRTEIHKLLARPDFAEKLNVSGSLEPLILSPADFAALIRHDYEKYGKLVKEMGIKLD